MSDDNIKIFYDTETTDKNLMTGRVVEFGFQVTQGDKIIERYQQYTNPETPSTYEAFQVHGISDDFLKDKPKFKDIYKKIVDILFKYDPHSLTMHNSEFDCTMLSQEFYRLYSDEKIHVMDYIKEKYPNFILEKNRTYHYDPETKKYTYTGKTVSELNRSEYTLSLIDMLPVEDTMLINANILDIKLSLNELAKTLDVDASNRADLHGALVDADLTFRCYRKLKQTYLKEFDFLDMMRNMIGMNKEKLTIRDEERVDQNVSNQLLDMSKHHQMNNQIEDASAPLVSTAPSIKKNRM